MATAGVVIAAPVSAMTNHAGSAGLLENNEKPALETSLVGKTPKVLLVNDLSACVSTVADAETTAEKDVCSTTISAVS